MFINNFCNNNKIYKLEKYQTCHRQDKYLLLNQDSELPKFLQFQNIMVLHDLIISELVFPLQRHAYLISIELHVHEILILLY